MVGLWKQSLLPLLYDTQDGLKLLDVASFFKRKAIVEEIKKKPHAQAPPTLSKPISSFSQLTPSLSQVDVASYSP